MDLNGSKNNKSLLLFAENKIEKLLAVFLPNGAAKTVVQLIKCGLVGVSNTFVDLGVFNALLFLTGMSRRGTGVVILIGISFCFAVTNSFIWNKKWTFRNKSANIEELKRQIIIFFFISLGGLVINLGAGHIVINIIGPHWGINPTLWANLGKVSGIVLTVLWNFTGYKLIVFK